MEDLVITITIPAEHKEDFKNLICYGGNYKEYVDDPDDPGEMILNPVSKEEFCEKQVLKVIKQYVKGKKHRRDENLLIKAREESVTTSLDSFLNK